MVLLALLGVIMTVSLPIGFIYFRNFYIDYWITKPKMPYPVHVFSTNFKWRYWFTRLFYGRNLTVYRNWLRSQRHSVAQTEDLEKKNQDFHHFAVTLKTSPKPGKVDSSIFIPAPEPLYSLKKLPEFTLPAGVEYRVFVPKQINPDKKLGILFYTHGGGWSYNDIDCYCMACAQYSRHCQGEFIVVAMNYRKSPEFAFPTQNNDVILAMLMFYSRIFAYQQNAPANSSKFEQNQEFLNLAPKIDLNKIALAGDSAGGNIMMGITYYYSKIARNFEKQKFFVNFEESFENLDLQNLPKFEIKHLVLLYPALHYPAANLGKYKSYKTYERYSYVIDTWNALEMWRDFGGLFEKNSKENQIHEKNLIKNPYFSIISTLDEKLEKKSKNEEEKILKEFFESLPNLTVIAAEHDPLIDEGKDFVEIVKKSGKVNSATHHTFPDTYHGFAILKIAQIGDIITKEICESWKNL